MGWDREVDVVCHALLVATVAVNDALVADVTRLPSSANGDERTVAAQEDTTVDLAERVANLTTVLTDLLRRRVPERGTCERERIVREAGQRRDLPLHRRMFHAHALVRDPRPACIVGQAGEVVATAMHLEQVERLSFRHEQIVGDLGRWRKDQATS